MFLPQGDPALWNDGRFIHRAFDINTGLGLEQFIAGQSSKAALHESDSVGRIHKNDIELLRAGRHPVKRVCTMDDHLRGPKKCHVVFELDTTGFVHFHQHDIFCPSGGGFKAQSTAPGKKIQALSLMKVRRQPVEHGFPHAVGSGSQIGAAAKANLAPFPFSTDDA